MTGGQPVDGPLSPRDIARQVAAEGVTKIVVVSDEPDKYPSGYFADDIAIHHRDELDAVQRELREIAGHARCCSTTRPARPRSAAAASAASSPIPAKRVVINELVCEGCGDCGVQVELRVGRAGGDRVRPQAHDRPVVVQQGLLVRQRLLPELRHRRRRPAAQAEEGARRPTSRSLPAPRARRRAEPYGILVTGIGGTGVVTIGALLGMAAHLEGKGCSVLDMTGLAQKNGAVVSHVRIADTPEQLYATRIAAGEAKLVLACDILTGVGYEALAKMQKGVTKALVNTALVMPAQFTREPDLRVPAPARWSRRSRTPSAPGDAEFLDATKLATGLMGDSIATNLFMVGYAYQRGLIPLSARPRSCGRSSSTAPAVESNKQSFHWGRLAARRSGAGRGRRDPDARASPTRSACRNRSTR